MKKSRRAALAKLLPMQRDDFIERFKIMGGLPVTIRLLDRRMHEFLRTPRGKSPRSRPPDDPKKLADRSRELQESTRCSASRLPPRHRLPEIAEMPGARHLRGCGCGSIATGKRWCRR